MFDAQLNFTAFAAVADVVMGRTLNPPFDPFKDDLSFLIGSYIFEDVGVSAYRVRTCLPRLNLGSPATKVFQLFTETLARTLTLTLPCKPRRQAALQLSVHEWHCLDVSNPAMPSVQNPDTFPHLAVTFALAARPCPYCSAHDLTARETLNPVP